MQHLQIEQRTKDGRLGCWPFSEQLGGNVENCPVVYPANAFDSRPRGDLVPLGSRPTKS